MYHSLVWNTDLFPTNEIKTQVDIFYNITGNHKEQLEPLKCVVKTPETKNHWKCTS